MQFVNSLSNIPSKLFTATAINAIGEIDSVGLPIMGKVRESYNLDSQALYRAIVTTDRISAFDRIIGLIPNKGAMLNYLSAWWFEQLNDIIPNHFIGLPHPNVMHVRYANTLPIEIVVRGYITGSTSTALWTLYEQGQRHAYGIVLPEGLKKNDRLPQPVITPTTKAHLGQHDQPISGDELLNKGIVSLELWQTIQTVALALFAKGQALADAAGLILVDTKYEFGLINGQLTLIDEVHTPDSSRYWDKYSYQMNPSLPHSYDKEQLRLWLASKGYRGEGDIPILDEQIIATLQDSYAYIVYALTQQHINLTDNNLEMIHAQVKALKNQYMAQ